MNLTRLINEGESFAKKNRPYAMDSLEEKGERWVEKSVNFLKNNYPTSVITNDFIKQSEKTEKNYNTMISILQGLKDAEEGIGTLKE